MLYGVIFGTGAEEIHKKWNGYNNTKMDDLHVNIIKKNVEEYYLYWPYLRFYDYFKIACINKGSWRGRKAVIATYTKSSKKNT